MTNFSDSFDRTNSTDLGASWVEVSGDWSIAANQLSPGAAGGTIILRAAGAMAGADHYVQTTIAATTAASHGIWGRGNSNISQGYLLRNDGSGWDLFAVVGGSFTVIGSYAVAAAPGDVVKLEMIGSSIKGYINGVTRISVTDTAVTTGTSVGFRSESSGAIKFDDFSAADISAGATLGIAAEVDAAQPMAGAKAATLGTAAEVSTAQPLAGAKFATLTSAGELDTAQPLTGGKTATLGLATAVETAQPLTGSVTAVLGTATAVETAMPLTGSKTAVLSTAHEVDTARPLTVPSTIVPSPERTYQIPAEERRLTVAAENRTMIVR